MFVPCEVAIWEMHKHKIESLIDLVDCVTFDCAFIGDLIGFIYEGEKIEARRFGDLTDFFLADDHCRLQTGGVDEVKNIGAEGVSILRDVFIPAHDMF